MKIGQLNNLILTEKFAEPISPKKFGTNIPDYDNGRVDYNPATRSFYTVVVPENGIYIPVLIRSGNGLVKFTYSDNENIGRMLMVKSYFREQYMIKSLPYINNVVFALFTIIKKYYFRLDSVTFGAKMDRLAKRLSFLTRSPYVQMFMKKYRLENYTKAYDEKRKVYYFQYNKNG